LSNLCWNPWRGVERPDRLWCNSYLGSTISRLIFLFGTKKDQFLCWLRIKPQYQLSLHLDTNSPTQFSFPAPRHPTKWSTITASREICLGETIHGWTTLYVASHGWGMKFYWVGTKNTIIFPSILFHWLFNLL